MKIISFGLLTTFFGESNSSCYVPPTGEDWFIANTGVSSREWADAVNSLLRTSGDRTVLLKNTTNNAASRVIRNLSRLEVEAFQIMVSNRGKSADDMVRILNENIPLNRTFEREPFQNAKVSIWYNYIINEKISVLRDDPEKVEKFVREQFRIRQLDSGIAVIELGRSAWHRIVLPVLTRRVPRTWPFLPIPTDSPRDLQRTLPPIAIDFVHQKLSMNEGINSWILFLDSTSELSKRLRIYAQSILLWATIDGRVLHHLTDIPNCENTDAVALASQVNSLFTIGTHPDFRVDYTPDRIKFWCEEIIVNTRSSSRGIFEAVGLVPKTEANLYRLRLEFLKKYLIDPLSDPIRETTRFDRIQGHGLLAAWEEFEAKTTNLKRKTCQHNLVIGSDDSMVEIDEFGTMNVRAKIQILEKLSDTFKPFEDLGQPDDLESISDTFDLSPSDALAYAQHIKSFKAIPERLANELMKVYQDSSVSTDATLILQKVRSKGCLLNRTTPQDVLDVYGMLMEAIEENSEKPFDLIGGLAYFSQHLWQTKIVLKRRSTLLSIAENNK